MEKLRQQLTLTFCFVHPAGFNSPHRKAPLALTVLLVIPLLFSWTPAYNASLSFGRWFSPEFGGLFGGSPKYTVFYLPSGGRRSPLISICVEFHMRHLSVFQNSTQCLLLSLCLRIVTLAS